MPLPSAPLNIEAALKLCSPLLSTLLVPLVTISPLLGQLPTPGATSDSISTPVLQLRVVEDQTNLSASSAGNGITVEVADNTGSRVANAAVVFRLPESGSTAAFRDGTYTAIIYTDVAGQARVSNIRWGSGAGTVPLRITASKGTLHAGLMFEKTMTTASIPTTNSSAQASVSAPKPVQLQSSPKLQASADPVPVSDAMPRVTIEHLGSHRSLASHSASARAIGAYDTSETPGETPKRTVAVDADDIDANVPLRHLANSTETGEAPGFSITNDRVASIGHSKKKWIIALAVAAAGAGAALAVMKEGKSGTTASSGVSIGAPTISVGHP